MIDGELVLLGMPPRAVPLTSAAQILARAGGSAPVAAVLSGWRLHGLIAGTLAAGFAGGLVVRGEAQPGPAGDSVVAFELTRLEVEKPVVPAVPDTPAPRRSVAVVTAAEPAPVALLHLTAPGLDSVVAALGVPPPIVPALLRADASTVAAGGGTSPSRVRLGASGGALVAGLPGHGPTVGPVVSFAVATPIRRVPRAPELGAEVDVAALDARPPRSVVSARAVASFPLAQGGVVPSVGWTAGARVPLGESPAQDGPAPTRFVTGPALDLALGQPGRARLRASLRVDLGAPGAVDPALRPAGRLTLGVDLPVKRT